MHAKWSQIAGWFERVCDLTEVEANALLERECQDADVRAEVLELVRAERRAGDTLEPSSEFRSILGPSDDDPALLAGPYRLQQRIGRGGMGEVWRADRSDGRFRKTVAIKIVKRGLDTDDVLRRFQRERQVLADLEHPHIARLLDAGRTADGRPYLVMEYIQGDPIDAFLARTQGSLTRRLELLATVAESVQIAHQRGIVHRDLKPSNILVTGDGSPRLLDFGIAKLMADDGQEDSLLTRTGQRVLTPRYASPEQVRGEEVFPATDVWALGILLYEFVTGRPPFEVDGVSQQALERSICEDEPPSPSKVTTVAGRRELSGDIDVIARRALSKEPSRRYSCAGDFATDLRRHLAGLPIHARPDRLFYRASKFVRRNKVLVGATLSVITSLAIGLLAAFSQYREAERKRGEAEAQRQIAEAVNEFLIEDLLRGADPGRSRDADVPMRVLLDAAADKIGERFRATPLVEAAVRHALAGTYTELGLAAVAEPHARRAYELRRAQLGDDHIDTFVAGRELASTLYNQGRLEESIAINEALWSRRRATHGADGYALVVGGNLATTYAEAGRYEEAVALHREILDVRLETWGEENENTLSSMNNLAIALMSLKRDEEALPLLTKATELRVKLLGADHPKALIARGNLASLLFRTGRHRAALERFREILSAQERVDGEDHPRTLTTINNIATCYLKLGERDAAERWLRVGIARASERGESAASQLAMMSKKLASLAPTEPIAEDDPSDDAGEH